VNEKEHPARVAGRYVRAAGVAIQRELERRAAEPEATPAQPAPETPQPTPQPTESAKAARRKGAQPLPERPRLDRVIWLAFLASLVSLALTGLQIQMLASDGAQKGIRLVLGAGLLLGATLILTNWERANERIVARVFKSLWGIGEPTGRSGRFSRGLVRNGMSLVGIVLLALAAFQILSAFVR
jgi:hypothetical protein